MAWGVYHDVCRVPESVVHSVTHQAWSEPQSSSLLVHTHIPTLSLFLIIVSLPTSIPTHTKSLTTNNKMDE